MMANVHQFFIRGSASLILVGGISIVLLSNAALGSPIGVELLSEERTIFLMDGTSVSSDGDFAPFDQDLERSYRGATIAMARMESDLDLDDGVLSMSANTSGDYSFDSTDLGGGEARLKLTFQVLEVVEFQVSGRVSGLHAYAHFRLPPVLSAYGNTIIHHIDDFGNYDTEEGIRLFQANGVLAPGEYTLEAESTADAGSFGMAARSSSQFTLTFQPVGTFAHWAQLNGFDPAVVDPSQISEATGLSLLMEYALGLRHGMSDSSRLLPVIAYDRDAGAAVLTYPKEREDLEYTVEWSTDGRGWSSEGIVKVPAGNSRTMATYAAAPGGHLMLRLKVAMPEG